MIEIKEIKRVFDLLLMVDSLKSCKVSELSKELKIRKTELMQFILDNPYNFKTFELFESKNNSKNGLYIENVYLSKEDNPSTDEWLQKMIKEYRNYIEISEWNNYGTIEGYYIEIDSNKEKLWRNTPEKINELYHLGLIKKGTFRIGGYWDESFHDKNYTITKDNIKKLEELGWRHNSIKINENEKN